MRLDIYLQNNNNITRTKAQELIKNGEVKVNNEVVLKPSYLVSLSDTVEILNNFKYVSRAGLKLEDAINSFNLNFKDKTIIDVGSSTGGFTDCSLKYGAKMVYAYDVGTNQMVEELKSNSKVKLFENTNILNVEKQTGDFLLIDVSFTSVLPIIKHVSEWSNNFVILFKPQFEVGQKHLKKGIVKDEKIVLKKLNEIIIELEKLNIKVRKYKKTLIKGKKGNQEYLLLGVKDA